MARLISNTQMELWLCDGFGRVKPLREGFAKYRARVLEDHADRVEAQVRAAKARSRSSRKKRQGQINSAKQKQAASN